MFRLTLIALLVSYCAHFFSQPVYSREFETRKKNVPLAIINNHPNYFFLLRYNRSAHDITIERRLKPSAEIISFTPLKLDSLNATWFDYEKLEYLFFENNYHTYFLFEKELNSKKAIYLKVIDTLGKSSGFIELAGVEKEKGVTAVNFEFKRTDNNNILIIASQTYGSFAVKKIALLFDPEKRKLIWSKKMPLENGYTGYSVAFECNRSNTLFCIYAKAHIVSYRRKYINRTQVSVPVLFYDSLTLGAFTQHSSMPVKADLAINNLSGLNSITLVPKEQQITVIAHFSKQDADGKANVYFLNQKFEASLSNQLYSNIIPLDTAIRTSLTFYDGTDFDGAAEKEYKHSAKFDQGSFNYQLSERAEDYYYKELIVWKNDLETGSILHQKIIPRKIYSFQGRTRFKNIAKAMSFIYENKLAVVVLEAGSNFKKDPNNFNYHRFKKETNLWNSNLVMYLLDENGRLEKKMVYSNTSYDAVPMPYQSNNQKEIILYLNGGKSEKFAILKLDQL